MKTFDEVWKEYEAKGYRFKPEALENARFGWNMCALAIGDYLIRELNRILTKVDAALHPRGY